MGDSTYRYTRADFDRVLQFLGGLYKPRDLDSLIEYMLKALSILGSIQSVGIGTYTRIGDNTFSVNSRGNPSEFAAPEVDSRKMRYAGKSSLTQGFMAGRASQEFTRWSDITDPAKFYRTDYYNEVCRPLRIRDGCALTFSHAGGRFTGVGVTHDKIIGARMRDMLVSISPHVMDAYRTVHTLAALADVSAHGGGRASAVGIVVLDNDGSVAFENPHASKLFSRYFEHRGRSGLPDEIDRWIERSPDPLARPTDLPRLRSPLTMFRAGERITIRLLSREGLRVLLMEEGGGQISPSDLSHLHLSKREAEVLSFIALGKTNPEIGIILGISARTVSKHVEHILEGLGVETRMAAAIVARDAANSLE